MALDHVRGRLKFRKAVLEFQGGFIMFYHVLSQSPAILHANSGTETLILTYWLNLFEVYSAHISTWWLGGKFRHGIQVCQEPPPLPPPLQPPPPEDFRYLPVISGQTLDIFGWQPHRIHVWYIYTNIGGILMVNVTIYIIHGSYGNWMTFVKFLSWVLQEPVATSFASAPSRPAAFLVQSLGSFGSPPIMN